MFIFCIQKVKNNKQQGRKSRKNVLRLLLQWTVEFVFVIFMMQLGGCHKSFRWKHRKILCVSLLGLSTTDKNNNWHFKCEHLVLSATRTHSSNLPVVFWAPAESEDVNRNCLSAVWVETSSCCREIFYKWTEDAPKTCVGIMWKSERVCSWIRERRRRKQSKSKTYNFTRNFIFFLFVFKLSVTVRFCSWLCRCLSGYCLYSYPYPYPYSYSYSKAFLSNWNE